MLLYSVLVTVVLIGWMVWYEVESSSSWSDVLLILVTVITLIFSIVSSLMGGFYPVFAIGILLLTFCLLNEYEVTSIKAFCQVSLWIMLLGVFICFIWKLYSYF